MRLPPMTDTEVIVGLEQLKRACGVGPKPGDRYSWLFPPKYARRFNLQEGDTFLGLLVTILPAEGEHPICLHDKWRVA